MIHNFESIFGLTVVIMFALIQQVTHKRNKDVKVAVSSEQSVRSSVWLLVMFRVWCRHSNTVHIPTWIYRTKVVIYACVCFVFFLSQMAWSPTGTVCSSWVNSHTLAAEHSVCVCVCAKLILSFSQYILQDQSSQTTNQNTAHQNTFQLSSTF